MVPSGDTTGLLSAPGPVVTWVGGPPSAGTVQIWYWPSLLRADENARALPSGVQAGSRSSFGPVISSSAWQPSGSMVQIWQFPSGRSLINDAGELFAEEN